MASEIIWRINAEGRTFDWKRNAGATTLNTRKEIQLRFDKPLCIRGTSNFPALKLGQDEIYFLPDAALIVAKGTVAAVNYQDFDLSNSPIRYIEEGRVPSDAPIVDQTWRYVNKKGGPDRRFNFNKQLPICVYGELQVWSESGLNYKVHCSNPLAADRLCKVIGVLHSSMLDLPKSIASIKTPKRWPLIALIVSSFVLAAIQIVFFANWHLLTKVSDSVSIPPTTSVYSGPSSVPVVTRPHMPNSNYNRSTYAAELSPSNIANISSLPGSVPIPRPRPKF